jgi:uncharacterized phage protein (TIGR02220 family)
VDAKATLLKGRFKKPRPRNRNIHTTRGLFISTRTHMINIDTRLLSKVDESELWLLTHIAKRINSQRECWPSNTTLCKETGFGIDKLQRVKKSLVEKGLMKVYPRKNKTGQTSNNYQVLTRFIGVYISLPDFQGGVGISDMEPLPETTLFPLPEEPTTEGLSKEVLTNKPTVEYVNEVIEFINSEKARFGIRGKVNWTKERQALIAARIKTTEVKKTDIFKMITHRCEVWKATEWEKFIRIETLFKASKFMGYIEESLAAPDKDWTESEREHIADQEDPKNKYSGMF